MVPVGFSVNEDLDAIEIRGRSLTESKKYRDVAQAGRAAVVVDDIASHDPWRCAGSRSAAAPRRSTVSAR